jgi:hypothetical protein
MVHSAYLTGFAYMWDCVVTEAERSGLVPATELVRIASDVWTLNEMFTAEMATSYRDAMSDASQTRSGAVGPRRGAGVRQCRGHGHGVGGR